MRPWSCGTIGLVSLRGETKEQLSPHAHREGATCQPMGEASSGTALPAPSAWTLSLQNWENKFDSPTQSKVCCYGSPARLRHSSIAGGSVKMHAHFRKQVGNFPKKRNMQLPYDQHALLGICPRKIKACTPMFTTALFLIAGNTGNNPRPLAGEWMLK